MTETTQKGPSAAEIRKLVERGQQGDRAALEELYLIHFDRIYSYLHMTVGNRHDAEDLTTQTFLRMLESIRKFRFQSAPFSAWLFRIAHNLSMDHFRANRRWHPEEEVPEPIRGQGLRRRWYTWWRFGELVISRRWRGGSMHCSTRCSRGARKRRRS
jgi:RNA polymerase sigma factor (sigma-70 family)